MVRTILVADDDEAILELLRRALGSEGYRVYEARTGAEAIDETRLRFPDLIVLELVLPELDGLEVCRVLRQETAIPILIVSAVTAERHKVAALHMGADDYLTKPFSLPELLARVVALLRRAQLPAIDVPPAVDDSNAFRLDRAAHTVHVHGQEVHLTPKEFDLLSLLLLHSGRVLSRDEIIRHVWGESFAGYHKTVDVHISWMRDKFHQHDHLPFRITTVPRRGYRLDRLG